MIESSGMLAPAGICHIGHIEQVVGKRVRVIGRLFAQDIHQQTVVLTSLTKNDASITVSVRLIYPFEASHGSLYEVIGEIVSSGVTPSLQAHTWRCMDGLDWTMYHKAVEMRRGYLERREQSVDSPANSGVG